VLDGEKAQVPPGADVRFDFANETIQIEKAERSTDWFSSPPRRWKLFFSAENGYLNG
jgi:hypothetical protein